ncbi:MAG TPA: family 16 glycosylhydrolase [Puia sp.]|jgi:beta-glucanase (GH16 family)|nr:family 16 glycosylhydrolase [Puia sp.]
MRNSYSTIAAFIVCVSIAACSKKNTTSSSPLPGVNIFDISQNRTTANSVFHFTVSLATASASDVSVDYATVAGTAIANTDFKPVSGTLTITAGSLSANIDVEIIGDSLRQANQTFLVQLSNPKHCTLIESQVTGTIVNSDLLYFPVDNTGYSTPNIYAGYTLKWSDEFNGNQINPNNWTFETGNNNGWGNAELENYTSSTNNAFVSQGNLIIEARQEPSSGFAYTSARMKTQGNQSFTYGRVDIRAKLPKGQGMWPALWLLGNNINSAGWPTCGEIDMMELLGQAPNKVYGTIHWGANFANHQSIGTNYILGSGSFDQQFHVYSLIWRQDSINMKIDDQQFFGASRNEVSSPYPFDNPFFFIFNIAVGGNWPGSPDATTVFPQRMIVDYVRVFQ